MNIKNAEAHAMARELAELEDTSVTEAVSTALREALQHRRAVATDRIQRARNTLEIMRAQLAASPGPSLHEVNASLFDDNGLPR